MIYQREVHFEVHGKWTLWDPSSVPSGLPSFDPCPVGMSQSLCTYCTIKLPAFSFGLVLDTSYVGAESAMERIRRK